MNGVVIVNKPKGITSHDVVAQCRRIYQTRRVGHTGTLDPLAQGVLPICVNKATRAAEFLTAETKRYTATLQLGVTFDTQDITGQQLTRCDVSIDQQRLRECIGGFVGEQDQIPPMYSAISQKGVRLYELARKGEVVQRQPRRVRFNFINILDICEDTVVIDVECSKGAYIRTLCADIGERLGVGGALAALTRTQVGDFRIEDSYTLEQLADPSRANSALIPIDQLFNQHPKLLLTQEQAQRVRNGVPIPFDTAGTYRLYSPENQFLCISKSDGRKLKMLKGFY